MNNVNRGSWISTQLPIPNMVLTPDIISSQKRVTLVKEIQINCLLFHFFPCSSELVNILVKSSVYRRLLSKRYNFGKSSKQ